MLFLYKQLRKWLQQQNATTMNIMENTTAQATALGMTQKAAERLASAVFGYNIASVCVGYAGSFLFGGNDIKVEVCYSKELCPNLFEQWSIELVFNFKTGTMKRANKPTEKQLIRKVRDNFASYLQGEDVYEFVKN